MPKPNKKNSNNNITHSASTPLLSVIVPTLNNGKDIAQFFVNLRKQIYPKKKLEIIVMDGGSKDKTIQIAKKYGARVIDNPYILADPGVKLGCQKAKGELLMVLAVDNVFQSIHALGQLVRIFQDDKTIFAAFPKHESRHNDSIFTKYINTFTDPFNHFIYGDASNGRTFKKLYKTIFASNMYDVYDFSNNENTPLISLAQGFTMRNRHKTSAGATYDDIAPVIEFINDNKKIAYAHSVSLYHYTYKTLKEFIRKQQWATVNALAKKNYGISYRYNALSSKQKIKVKLWPLYGISIILPVFRSVIGVFQDKEIVWIIHPFLCFVSVATSTYTILLYTINKQIILTR